MFIEYKNSNENKFRNRLCIPQQSIIKVYNKSLMFFKRYFPLMIKANKTFIFHSSYYRYCKSKNAINIVTVHDFTYEYFRHGLSKILHCKTKHKAISKADYIVCISENTKKDLLKILPSVNSDRVIVIYNGVGDAFRILDETQRYNAGNEKFLLFVGGRDSYKNFDIAVNLSLKTGIKLYIVGKRLSKFEKFKVESLIGKNYVDVGFVSDEQLNCLYNKAFALVYPSSYEGFGIPVVEAQKAGCPVIAQNKSSISEIIGATELLTDSSNLNNFVEKVLLLENMNFRDYVIKVGLKNSQRFTWDNTYNEYLQLYSRILYDRM